MLDATVFELLIAYTALLLTASSGVIAFLLYHFIPLKTDVARMQVEINTIGDAVDETRRRQTELIAALNNGGLDGLSEIDNEDE